MAILYFSDILKKVGLESSKVKLIRHTVSDPGFKACYNANMVFEYTCHQKAGFSTKYDYWIVFIGSQGGLSKLYACYKVGGFVPDTPDVVSANLPLAEKLTYQGNNVYFDLKPVDLLAEYEHRLVIDWGKSTRMWHQKGSIEKPIVSIQATPKMTFSGYESLLLPYRELKEIVENETGYEAWHAALSSVNAIYLIVDQETGHQYVGSAYGKDGLLGRWSCYVQTYHGNNKLMKELICDFPARYEHFQFSILQILPKSITDEEVVQIENRYKSKLMTTKFGMNAN